MRKGDDIYLTHEISYSQAVLGDNVEMPTLDKSPSHEASADRRKHIIVTVPAGTESGKILRISEKGIPHYGMRGRGNMYVELIIKTPKKVSREQKKLLEQLREEGL